MIKDPKLGLETAQHVDEGRHTQETRREKENDAGV